MKARSVLLKDYRTRMVASRTRTTLNGSKGQPGWKADLRSPSFQVKALDRKPPTDCIGLRSPRNTPSVKVGGCSPSLICIIQGTSDCTRDRFKSPAQVLVPSILVPKGLICSIVEVAPHRRSPSQDLPASLAPDQNVEKTTGLDSKRQPKAPIHGRAQNQDNRISN